MIVDLETVDPRGRIDVLAYRGLEHIAKQVEETHGINGLWDAVKPHVNTMVNETITGLDIPEPAKVLLRILQMNYVPPQIQQKEG